MNPLNLGFNYVYAVEVVVIVAILIFLGYVWYELGVFKKKR